MDKDELYYIYDATVADIMQRLSDEFKDNRYYIFDNVNMKDPTHLCVLHIATLAAAVDGKPVIVSMNWFRYLINYLSSKWFRLNIHHTGMKQVGHNLDDMIYDFNSDITGCDRLRLSNIYDAYYNVKLIKQQMNTTNYAK